MKMVQQSVIKIRFYLEEYILCVWGGTRILILIKLSFVSSVYKEFFRINIDAIWGFNNHLVTYLEESV